MNALYSETYYICGMKMSDFDITKIHFDILKRVFIMYLDQLSSIFETVFKLTRKSYLIRYREHALVAWAAGWFSTTRHQFLIRENDCRTIVGLLQQKH